MICSGIHFVTNVEYICYKCTSIIIYLQKLLSVLNVSVIGDYRRVQKLVKY